MNADKGSLRVVAFVVPFYLTLNGCFSAAQDMGRATGGSTSAEARRDAAIADVVTLPVQVPLVAGLAVLSAPALLKGDGRPDQIAGVKRIWLRVLDDEGVPVPGVAARLGYQRGNHLGPTDAQGFFPKPLKVSLLWSSDLAVSKPGYYFITLKDATQIIPRKESQPVEMTIDISLRKIRHPVAMYARRMRTDWPETEAPVGYDLQRGDWLPPYGQGFTEDVIFKRTFVRRGEGNSDFELTMKFVQPGDGIQLFSSEGIVPGSYYQAPAYFAPAEGYLPEWKWWDRRRPGGEWQRNIEREPGYFIRVRTELDKEGNVIRAQYGKIYGTAYALVHYLNPDGTRNIEFDSSKNLMIKKPQDRNSSDFLLQP